MTKTIVKDKYKSSGNTYSIETDKGKQNIHLLYVYKNDEIMGVTNIREIVDMKKEKKEKRKRKKATLKD